MKKQFALMLALASTVAFTSCDDDDDNDSSQISTTKFAGSSTITVMNVSVPIENDTLVLAPMTGVDTELYKLTLGARSGNVNMGQASMPFGVDAFTVDSLVATVTDANNYSLKRANSFALTGVGVVYSTISAPMAVSGTVSKATVTEGVLNVEFTDMKLGAMPFAMTLSYEGQSVK